MPDSHRRRALSAAALILVAILLVTSRPSGDAPPEGGFVACLFCQERRVADGVVNVALFVPLGLALASASWSLRRIAVVSFLASLSIESVQFLIPGRYPDVVDLFTNAAGGALGGWLASRATRWVTAPRSSIRLWAAVASVPSIVGFTGWALAPAAAVPAYAHWAPDFGSLEPWTGQVRSVRLGRTPVPPGRLADPAGFMSRLLAGAPLEVTALAGRPPSRQSAIVSVTDPAQRGILLLGPRGDDLVWNQRRRSADFFLDAPTIRFASALRGLSPGTPLQITVVPARDGTCLDLNGAQRCAPRFSAGSGWALLYAANSWPEPVRRALDFASLAALVIPAALLLRAVPIAAAGAAIATVTAGTAVAARWGGLAPLGPLELLGLGCGVMLGLALGRPRTGKT